LSRAVKEQTTTLGAWGDEFELVLRPSGVAVLTMNAPGGVNALSSEVISHFGQALDFVLNEPEVKALVLTSGKKNIFIVGADIREILRIQKKAEAHELTTRGHLVLQKLSKLPMPVVAAIDGICFGGGVELILCCDKRIATNDQNTSFALPEVNLGLIPGLGGTQRLPRLIGLKAALELIMSGEPIDVQQAQAIGLIDHVVDRDVLLETAANKALELIEQNFDRDKIKAERELASEESDGGASKRINLLKITDRAVRVRTRGLYPSPRKAIEAIQKGLEEGLAVGLLNEAEIFAEMAVSSMAKNMINFYISKEMAVQTARRARQEFGNVTTMGIIGTGEMGSEIAALAIAKNINVILKGSSEEKTVAAADVLMKRTEALFPGKNGEKQPVIEAAEVNLDLRPAQLIVEAVYEDPDLKNKVIFEISRAASPGCVIASNTSSFAISNLSQFSDKPERIVGLHFFNPVDRMPLVEVITHARTDQEVLKKAIAIVDQMGKVPVTVKDSPGFLVNRLLTVFLEEAARMGDEGIPLNWIEDAALAFGMPISPFWLVDELGLRLCNKVTRLLFEKLGARFEPPAMLDGLLQHEFDGRKTGAGIYLWDESGKRLGLHKELLDKIPHMTIVEGKADEHTAKLITDRLFLPMIDEAARCLEEKIVRKAKDIDLALILGIAFPRFRGGLLRYADDLGIEYVVKKLEEIYERYEPAREISGLLLNLHKDGRRFYGLGQG